MSLDDFYLTSSGLAATETTLFTYDKELLRDLQVVGAIMEPIRVMTANRLAQNGSQWMDIFKQFNRYTVYTLLNCKFHLLRIPCSSTHVKIVFTVYITN